MSQLPQLQDLDGGVSSQQRSFQAMTIFAVAAGLTLVLPFVEHVSVHLMAFAMLLLVLGGAWYRWQAGRFDAFETIFALGFLHFVFFGLGAIWMMQDPHRVAADPYLVDFVPRATLYCLLGLATTMAGYFGPWFGKVRERRFEDVPVNALFVTIPGAIGFVGSMAAAAWAWGSWAGIRLPGFVSSLGQLAPLFLFAWGLGWLLVLSGRATPRQRRWFLVLFIPASLMILGTNLSSKSLVLTIAGVPLMAIWYARRRIPWKTLTALLLVLIFVIFPFYNNYRNIDARLGTRERVDLTLRAMQTWDSVHYVDQSVAEFKARMSLISPVAVVIRDVPRWVPYEHGATLFLPTLAYAIPRVLWPDKPSSDLGRRFGTTFRMVHILDDKTSVEPTVPGELFWNFDLPGVLVGMLLWGATLRWFYRRYGESSSSLDPVRRAVHMVLLLDFVHFGAGMAAHYVTSIRIVVLLEVFCFVARRVGWLERRRV